MGGERGRRTGQHVPCHDRDSSSRCGRRSQGNCPTSCSDDLDPEQATRHPLRILLAVIVITAVDELDSVVRCIEMGATDYLPKPFDAAILRARLVASLAGKRLRDLELEYVEQVGHVVRAASAVEAGEFDAVSVETVAARDDALGGLARTFVAMADEVRAREARLQAEVRELRIEIDDARQSTKVAEITSTEYFKDLRSRAAELRRMVGDQGGGGRG
jgi:DNA-binding response OmpR family regulator